MRRAGLKSGKPIDVFKMKARDKGKPEAEAPWPLTGRWS